MIGTPPNSLSEVHARRPILGSGKVPKDLVEIAKTRSHYIQAKEKRSVDLRQVGKGDERVWQNVKFGTPIITQTNVSDHLPLTCDVAIQ